MSRPARKRQKKTVKQRVEHACARCGVAVAAGVLFCAECLGAAGPAQAQVRPAAPESAQVEFCPARPVAGYPFATLAELGKQGWPGLPPGDRPDSHDLPEPDGTFYTPEVVAVGTASTTSVPRQLRRPVRAPYIPLPRGRIMAVPVSTPPVPPQPQPRRPVRPPVITKSRVSGPVP